MEMERAREILNSIKTVEVFYEGTAIWIENLNPANQTADVRTLAGPKTVPVSQLIELS